MAIEAHRKRHILLHRHLDELVADFIDHIPLDDMRELGILGRNIGELMIWSYGQTINPTEKKP
jgi:hypothetical protein